MPNTINRLLPALAALLLGTCAQAQVKCEMPNGITITQNLGGCPLDAKAAYTLDGQPLPKPSETPEGQAALKRMEEEKTRLQRHREQIEQANVAAQQTTAQTQATPVAVKPKKNDGFPLGLLAIGVFLGLLLFKKLFPGSGSKFESPMPSAQKVPRPKLSIYDLSRPESRRINANLRITYQSASGVVTNQDILVDHYYSNGKEAVMHALHHGRDGERTFFSCRVLQAYDLSTGGIIKSLPRWLDSQPSKR